MLQNRSSESNCGHFGKLQETQTNLQRRASEKDSQALDDKLYKRVGQLKEKPSLKPTSYNLTESPMNKIGL